MKSVHTSALTPGRVCGTLAAFFQSPISKATTKAGLGMANSVSPDNYRVIIIAERGVTRRGGTKQWALSPVLQKRGQTCPRDQEDNPEGVSQNEN